MHENSINSQFCGISDKGLVGIYLCLVNAFFFYCFSLDIKVNDVNKILSGGF